MPDNAEILREAFARFEQDGVPQFDTFDPDIELINFEEFPVTGPYRGWDGVVQWLVDMSEPFDDFRFELAEVLGSRGDDVVTKLRFSGDSRVHGPKFELVWGAVWSFRNGKVTRTEGFRTPEEAVEAAGL